MYTPAGNVTSMTMGLNLNTGQIVHYSNRPEFYDEPEGIFPEGQRTLVESNRQNPQMPGMKNYQPIDLWILELDGSERMTRLTYFNDDPDFKSSQGVISDDGRFMAFQISRTRDQTGYGYGILVMDIENYMAAQGITFLVTKLSDITCIGRLGAIRGLIVLACSVRGPLRGHRWRANAPPPSRPFNAPGSSC